MGVCDANYKFTFVDIGTNGRISDGGVFNKCPLARALEENTLGIPEPEECAGFSKKMPYVLVADDAFPLKTYLMKPFPKSNLTTIHRIYNYRLSRARRVVENAFGIMANRFRILLQPLNLDIEKIEEIVWTCCCLHNFLRDTSGNDSESDKEGDVGNFVPGSWRQEAISQGSFVSLARLHGQRLPSAAKSVREDFARYFSGHGAIPWQEKYAKK